MQIDKNMAELICKLEDIIGWQTYNPNSYNGWTGEEGCSFKYPVNYCETKKDLKEEKLTKTKGMISYINPDCISTMKYMFGSNHLYIGDGIVKALNFLEEQYDLDFNKLEEIRTEKRKRKMLEILEQLESGDEVQILAGRWKVGIDIPEGKYLLTNPRTLCLSVSVYSSKGKEIRDIFISGKEESSVTLKDGYEIYSYHEYCLRKKG